MSRDGNNGFDEWGGYMDAKITKLEEQFSAASDPFRKTNLFAGISIYVNGRTDPSADELKRIMMVHGGTFHHYERAHTTYIIASNLPDVKVRNMNTSKIISPKWVVDCLREKRILDYAQYLLYTNQRTTQPRLNFGLIKNEPTPSSANSLASDVSSIMQELKELNAKIRQSLPGVAPAAAADAKPERKQSASELERKPLQPIVNVSSENSSRSSIARTAVDPKFLSEFYNNSRLHHIATLGAGFKQYVNELREAHGSGSFPARTHLRKMLLSSGLSISTAKSNGCVMHIDMDCFFVSVGLRKQPQLRGQPVAVTHSKGGSTAAEVPVNPSSDRQAEMELFANRFEHKLHNSILSEKVRQGFDSKMSLSEIASCSYEAREKGLRNGMFVGQALKLCPELKTIPYDFEGYREVAFTLYDTIAQYTLNIEAVSCDEMFVELTELLDDLQVKPMAFVTAIREEVRQKTGCPCSAGVGANKLQARMATKRAKPDGQYQLVADDVNAYMADIPISELPGVGSSTMHTLKEANLLTCGDLQNVSLAKLQMHVGKKFGETLHQFCRGIDNRSLVYGQIRKSVSAEVNYGIRFNEYSELETFLRQLCTEVHTRLNDIQRKTKCITLKLMVRAKDAPLEASKFMGHGVCDNVTKSVSLSDFTDDLELISRTVLTTMKSLSLPPKELRGIGIQLTKLNDPNEGKEKKENVIKNMFSKMAEMQQIKESSALKTVTIEKPINSDTELKSTKTEFSGRKTRSRTAIALAGTSVPVNTTKEATNDTIFDMLKNAAAKRSEALAITNSISSSQCPPTVDPTVFSELPNDIRAEILREYERLNPPLTTESNKSTASNRFELNESDLRPSTSKAAKERLERKRNATTEKSDLVQQKINVDEEFLRALPPEIRAEIEMQLKAEQMQTLLSTVQDLGELSCRPPAELFAETKTNASVESISIDNIFAQPKCIELLLEWVQSCNVPEQYDVNLVCIHAQEYVRNKRIDELYDPLMYLCRLINSQKSTVNDCAWHAAYRLIVEAVQLEMRSIYEGRKLFLGVKLDCDKCCLSN